MYVNGWNSYWLLQESVWSYSRSRVSEIMKQGSEMGLTVCRTWAFNDGDDANALQKRPGHFNERVFKVSLTVWYLVFLYVRSVPEL